MDIYKCPKSISGNTFGKQKSSFLYILTIFLLNEQRTKVLRTSPYQLLINVDPNATGNAMRYNEFQMKI